VDEAEVARPVRIGVIGGSRCTKRVARLAEVAGEALARAGAIVICGGLGGVMAAAARGAARAGGTVVGILPGHDAAEANPWVHLPLPTGQGLARNVLVVAASEAIVALPGAAGTRSEIAFAGVLGRPVVALGRDEPDLDVRARTDDAAAAARRAVRLAVQARSGRAG
jgi:uncharacterized protein (TIGR00725 family)